MLIAPKFIDHICTKRYRKSVAMIDLYRCSCGKEFIAHRNNVKTGHTKSCGCLAKENARHLFKIHGDCVDRVKSAEFTAWINMNERCYNSRRSDYRNYGGRGIGVCRPWRESFKSFLSDMGRRPSDKHSLDRIDNDDNYTPLNCRWATSVQQNNNRRNSIATH
jgi:hypothetical protein